MLELYAKDFIRDNQIYIKVRDFTKEELLASFKKEQENQIIPLPADREYECDKWDFKYLDSFEAKLNEREATKLIYSILKQSKDEFLLAYITYLMSPEYQEYRINIGVDKTIEAIQPNKAFWSADSDCHNLSLNGDTSIMIFWENTYLYRGIVDSIKNSDIELDFFGPTSIFTIVANICFIVKSKKTLMIDFNDLSNTMQMILHVENLF